jgi:hypothetical protein
LIGLSVVIDELPDNDELENDDFDEISSSRVNFFLKNRDFWKLSKIAKMC